MSDWLTLIRRCQIGLRNLPSQEHGILIQRSLNGLNLDGLKGLIMAEVISYLDCAAAFRKIDTLSSPLQHNLLLMNAYLH